MSFMQPLYAPVVAEVKDTIHYFKTIDRRQVPRACRTPTHSATRGVCWRLS
jgi:hypothetical protein